MPAFARCFDVTWDFDVALGVGADFAFEVDFALEDAEDLLTRDLRALDAAPFRADDRLTRLDEEEAFVVLALAAPRTIMACPG